MVFVPEFNMFLRVWIPSFFQRVLNGVCRIADLAAPIPGLKFCDVLHLRSWLYPGLSVIYKSSTSTHETLNHSTLHLWHRYMPTMSFPHQIRLHLPRAHDQHRNSAGSGGLRLSDFHIKFLAEEESMSKRWITEIQVCERQLELDKGFLHTMHAGFTSLLSEDYRLIPEIVHKSLIFSFTPSIVMDGSRTIYDKIMVEKTHHGCSMELLPEDRSATEVGNSHTADNTYSRRITPRDVAKAFLSYRHSFPIYEPHVFNCWFFCVAMLRVLADLDVEGYMDSLQVTRVGLWKRKPRSTTLTPTQQLVFDCVVPLRLDYKGRAMSKNLGHLCVLLPVWGGKPQQRVERKCLGFKLCLRKLEFYHAKGYMPEASDLANAIFAGIIAPVIDSAGEEDSEDLFVKDIPEVIDVPPAYSSVLRYDA